MTESSDLPVGDGTPPVTTDINKKIVPMRREERDIERAHDRELRIRNSLDALDAELKRLRKIVEDA